MGSFGFCSLNQQVRGAEKFTDLRSEHESKTAKPRVGRPWLVAKWWRDVFQRNSGQVCGEGSISKGCSGVSAVTGGSCMQRAESGESNRVELCRVPLVTLPLH